MKRIFIATLFVLAAAHAGAQTMYDALTFSKNNYYGTARSIGMGNAMTAVGGDLGSIGINPAGSAVAGYSQFTITPNLTVSILNSSYSAYPDAQGVDHYINERNNTFTRFSMPNIGATFNFNTGRNYGLQAITYGFVLNGTNNFTDKMMAGGVNDRTSYLGAMASSSYGYDIDIMNGFRDVDMNEIDVWDYAYYNTNIPFNSIVNAQAGAISNYGYDTDSDYYWRYVGATEIPFPAGVDDQGNNLYDIELGGPLDQTYGRMITGSKYDALFNVGFNFNNRFYLGANLGITGLNYNFDEYFKEYAQDPADFPINLTDKNGNPYMINFNNYRTRYSYAANGTGIYGKFGFIAKPIEGLRLGAAIQTPTAMQISEIWKHAVDIHYNGAQARDGEAASPEGNYDYRLRSPYRINAGVAYTIMRMALISLDYEMTDYSSMRFRSRDGGYGTFDGVNDDIASYMGMSHMIRVGAECKPIPEFAIRAGYNFSMTPEDIGNETLQDKLNIFSAGIGYSSPGSFFADLAARFWTMSDEYVSPYAYPEADNLVTPLILNKRSRMDFTVTIGFRF